MKNVVQGILTECVIAVALLFTGTSAVASELPKLSGGLAVAVDAPDVAILKGMVGVGRVGEP